MPQFSKRLLTNVKMLWVLDGESLRSIIEPFGLLPGLLVVTLRLLMSNIRCRPAPRTADSRFALDYLIGLARKRAGLRPKSSQTRTSAGAALPVGAAGSLSGSERAGHRRYRQVGAGDEGSIGGVDRGADAHLGRLRTGHLILTNIIPMGTMIIPLYHSTIFYSFTLGPHGPTVTKLFLLLLDAAVREHQLG